MAQMPGGSPGGLNASFAKLFADLPWFSAKADLRVIDEAQQEWLRAPISLAMLTNSIRLEMDVTQIKNKEAAERASILKEMGMAQVVSITRPDKASVFVMFPAIQSCLEMPMDPQELTMLSKGPSLQKTELGREKVRGYQCLKHKVVVSGDAGPILEAVTWNAPELKDFPIRIEAKEEGKTSILEFQDIQLSKPDISHFEVPVSFNRFKDQKEMMTSLSRKASEKGRAK